jgi:signal transduction histidine kinase
MSRLTLRGRVTVATVAVLVVALAALSVLFNVLLSERLETDASAVLQDRADAQLATLDLSRRGLRPAERPSDFALDRDAWMLSGGRVVERPPGATRAAERRVVMLAAAASRPMERTVRGDVRLRAVPVRGPHGERHGTVVVAVSLVPYLHTRRIALVGTALLSFGLLLAAAIAVRWAVRSALRPIAEMTARAADWSAHDLHQRFNLGPPRDELTTLASTFDGLLARIEGVLRHEQRFSAELAHELRTPLAGLRAEAELALRRPVLDEQSRLAFRGVLEGSARMQKVIETLIASARVEEGAGAAGSCDPVPAVREAIAAVENAARAREVRLRLAEPASDVMVNADPGVVAQALYPLLENGVRHARGSVDVVLGRDHDAVVVSVRDDGPGLAGRDPASVFAPGVSTSGGAGLGLPLARRLARGCGGDVVAADDAFELRLPGGARG